MKWRIWKNGIGRYAWCLTTHYTTYRGFSSFDSAVLFADYIAPADFSESTSDCGGLLQ